MRSFLNITLTLLALGYCLTLLDLDLVSTLTKSASPEFFYVGFAVVILSTVLGAIRFKILLDPLFSMSLQEHIKQYFAANYFNLFLPSAIGGDAARVVMLGNVGCSKTSAAVVVTLERSLGTITLLLLSVVATLYVSNLPEIILYGIYMASAIMIVAIAIGSWLLNRFSSSRYEWLGNVMTVLHQIKSTPRRIVIALAISFLFQVMNITVTFLVVRAFGLPVGFYSILALVPIVSIVTSIPISISGIGVREITFVYLFATIGVSEEASVVMSVGTYLVFVSAGLLGGAWFTLDSFKQKLSVPQH